MKLRYDVGEKVYLETRGNYFSYRMRDRILNAGEKWSTEPEKTFRMIRFPAHDMMVVFSAFDGLAQVLTTEEADCCVFKKEKP
jgi:hypothetical protein